MGGIVLGAVLAVSTPVAAGAESQVVLRPSITLKRADLRVGDLVALRRGKLPARIADMVVASLPLGETVMDLPAEQAAALVRRRVPALHPTVTPGTVVHIRMLASSLKAVAVGTCFATMSDLAAGAAITAADVTQADCGVRPIARLRYGQGGLVIAGEAIPAGAYLGRLPALPKRAIGKGALLTLRSSAGPVTIERSVVAMQPARSGGKLFVRDENGSVFAAPLALSEEGQAQ